MIGYYVHHQGMGHAHRAVAIAEELRGEVTGLSSLDRPHGWAHEWLQLPRDDDDVGSAVDADARGHLHWVPENCHGLRYRMGAMSRWIERARPELMVVDVSVEVALLARLHGVPVVTMVLPGTRADSAHALVHGIARRMIAAWPADVDGMLAGVAADDPRLVHVGGVSRFDRRAVSEAGADNQRVTVILGQGGSAVQEADVEGARAATPGWTWTVVGAASWASDPWPALLDAEVVVAHAGQNSIAEIAAARRPAVLIPQDRPFGEQHIMVSTLRQDGRFPAVALNEFPTTGWPEILTVASYLDADRWKLWNDGRGAARAAEVIMDELAV